MATARGKVEIMDTIVTTVWSQPAVLIVFGFVLGICLAVIIYHAVSKTRAKTFEQDMQRQIEGAKREAENIIKSAQIEAATEAIKKKSSSLLRQTRLTPGCMKSK